MYTRYYTFSRPKYNVFAIQQKIYNSFLCSHFLHFITYYLIIKFHYTLYLVTLCHFLLPYCLIIFWGLAKWSVVAGKYYVNSHKLFKFKEMINKWMRKKWIEMRISNLKYSYSSLIYGKPSIKYSDFIWRDRLFKVFQI